jgi:amidase
MLDLLVLSISWVSRNTSSLCLLTLLDFCACTFPVTFVDKSLDKARDMTTFKQLTDIDGRIQKDYDAEFYHGAPVALQIVGRRLEEEKVLEMCEVIDGALKASPRP